MARALCGLVLILGCGGNSGTPLRDAAVDGSAGTDTGAVAPDAGQADTDAGPGGPECPALGTPRAACTPSGSGQSLWFAMDVFEVARLDVDLLPGVVPGFNLDGLVSDTFDPCGCFRADFRSGPPSNLEGVDSEIGNLLATLGITDLVNVDVERTMRDGSLLLIFAVHDVDDMVEDDCVTVDILRGQLPDGVSAPEYDAGGRLVPGQTFDIDPASLAADGSPLFHFAAGRIEGGRVRAAGAELFDQSLFVDGAWFHVRHRVPEIAFNLDASALTEGVVGGTVPIEELIDMNDVAIATWEAVTAELLRTLMQQEADLFPVDGRCSAISVSEVFAATPVMAPGTAP